MSNDNNEILERIDLLEARMVRMLHKLEERISLIETNFNEAAKLANGLMDGGSFFNRGDLEQFRETFMGNQTDIGTIPNLDSISDTLKSLTSLREKLSNIQGAIKDQGFSQKPR